MRAVFLVLSAICAAPFVVAALFALFPPLRGLFARLLARRIARGVENGTVQVVGFEAFRGPFGPPPSRGGPGRPPPGVIDTTGEELPSVPPSRLTDGDS